MTGSAHTFNIGILRRCERVSSEKREIGAKNHPA